jgi:hypothetical protein
VNRGAKAEPSRGTVESTRDVTVDEPGRSTVPDLEITTRGETMKRVRTSILTVAAVVLATTAIAQERKPLSPPAKAEAVIAGNPISIDYSAPSKRERVIMGGLVPFDKVWRTGANAATTLRTEADLMVGDLHVPAGTYTLFTIPGESEWTLIINRQTGQWGTNYDATKDLGRIPMTVHAVGDTVETFVISIEPGEGANGNLKMTWENVEASVPVLVH